MKTTFLAVFLLFFVCITSAQEGESVPYIEVNGSAEMELVPNIIIYTVELKEYEKDRKKVSLEEIEERFLEAVNSSGVEEDNISISKISGDSFTSKRKRKSFASKTYELKFKNQVGLLNFIGRLEDVDIDRQFISKLSHTDLTTYRLEIKKKALLAAKTKAEALLQAVGAQLGKPIMIKEDPITRDYYKSTGSNTLYAALDDSVFPNDIGFKKIKLRFEIMARFEIN